MKGNLLGAFRRWLDRWLRRPPRSLERQRALDLLAAIDAGGVPLNPARVNDIARQLGLEVSTKAPMADTIARIRACAREW
ncbi:MAG: hypothetical protein IPN53_09515 [Comamonadaceae bacterium]|nr:hypothetical protein [Comamonadaceae bacterium]